MPIRHLSDRLHCLTCPSNTAVIDPTDHHLIAFRQAVERDDCTFQKMFLILKLGCWNEGAGGDKGGRPGRMKPARPVTLEAASAYFFRRVQIWS